MGKEEEGGVYPDCWHLPGGGLDAGETKQEGLRREIKEETGMDITGLPTKLLSDKDTGEHVKTDNKTGETYLAKMQFNDYQVELDKNADEVKITLGDDLVEYRWVSIGDLKNYHLTPPSQKLFTSLGWI